MSSHSGGDRAVLLARIGPVHRPDGGRTACGLIIPAGARVVTDVQIMAYSLGRCARCFPAAQRQPRPWGGPAMTAAGS